MLCAANRTKVFLRILHKNGAILATSLFADCVVGLLVFIVRDITLVCGQIVILARLLTFICIISACSPIPVHVRRHTTVLAPLRESVKELLILAAYVIIHCVLALISTMCYLIRQALGFAPRTEACVCVQKGAIAAIINTLTSVSVSHLAILASQTACPI